MAAMLRLESFDGERAPQDDTPVLPHEVETLRGRAFEEGYGAGWSDALEQMRNEDSLRRAAAEEALQAVAFTYKEACAALEGSFVELAAQMIESVLPGLTRNALPDHLERELRALAARQFGQRLEVHCAPSVHDMLAEYCARVQGLDVTLQVESSFSEAQVMLRIDQMTRMIDLDGVLAALQAGLALPTDHKDAFHG
jgi:flagellar assembly protein FliH